MNFKHDNLEHDKDIRKKTPDRYYTKWSRGLAAKEIRRLLLDASKVENI